MSYNEIKQVDFDANDALEFIRNQKDNLQGLTTEEDYLKNENDILNFNQRLRELEESLREISLFDQNDSYYFNQKTNYLRIMFGSFFKKKQELSSLLNIYKSRIELQKALINGKIKEVNQKTGSIKNLKNEFGFVLTESFSNLFNTNYENIISGKINIDTESETATLPVKESKVVRPNKIYISAESNGTTGRYKTNENSLPYYLIDGNSLSHFEYHKVEEGPLVCELVFEMPVEAVINRVEVKRKSFSVSSDINIKDITFTDGNGESVSIKELVDTNFQSLKVSSSDNDGKLSINHLPVRTKRLSLLMQQENYQLNGNERVFALAIESIFFYSQKFLNYGEYNLNSSFVPGGYFAAKGTLHSFPKGRGHRSQISILEEDNNSIREEFVRGETNSILLDGKEKNIKYTFSSQKNFNFNSVEEKLPLMKTSGKEKQVNKSVETDSILVNQVYEEGKLFVYENVLRRARRFKEAARLGTHTGNDSRSFNFPVSNKQYKLKTNELSIYVNGNAIADTEYSFDNSESKLNIDFSSNTDKVLKRVKVLLKPKKPICFLKPEGIYIRIEEDFDIDQDNINIINYTKRGPERLNISEGETEVYLKENVDTVRLFRGGFPVNNLEQIGISIDNDSGFMKIPEQYTNLPFEISYTYKEENEIKNYFVWFDEEPKGLFIPRQNVSVKEYKQKLSTSNASSNHFSLREKSILLNTVKFDFGKYKEKTFIDGTTEFNDFLFMEREKVPSIETDDGFVEFTLSQTPILTKPILAYNSKEDIYYDVVVDGSAPEENEISIFANGSCVLHIEEGDISENIFISYSYEGEQDTTKYFSVDGTRGIVYFSENVDSPDTKEITYTVFDVDLEYSLINKLDYEIGNKEVFFSTNKLNQNRSKVKAVWGYPDRSISFEKLEDYFSPIFYEMTLGFN